MVDQTSCCMKIQVGMMLFFEDEVKKAWWKLGKVFPVFSVCLDIWIEHVRSTRITGTDVLNRWTCKKNWKSERYFLNRFYMLLHCVNFGHILATLCLSRCFSVRNFAALSELKFRKNLGIWVFWCMSATYVRPSRPDLIAHDRLRLIFLAHNLFLGPI